MFEKMKRAKRVLDYVAKMRTSDMIKADIQLDIMKRIEEIKAAREAGKLKHLDPDAIEIYIEGLKKLIALYGNLDKPGQKSLLKHLKHLKDRYGNLDKTISKVIGVNPG